MRKIKQYYDYERRKGRRFSALLHLALLLLALFGLPSFFDSKPPEEPQAITVELLPITGITNVKPEEQPPTPEQKPEPPKPQPEVKKPEPPAPPAPPKPVTKEAPPVKTAEATPPPPKETVPDDKAKEKPPEPKKEAPKKEEKKPEPKKEDKKNKADDLNAVLKAVKEAAKKEKTDEKKEPKDKSAADSSSKKALSTQYDPNMAMSLSEKDAIRSQIARCWNVPAGAKDAQDLVVVLRLQLQQDGTVLSVELGEDTARYNSDTFFRAAADSAMRAVRECSPLQNLPPEKFQSWHDMELTFDPKEMLF